MWIIADSEDQSDSGGEWTDVVHLGDGACDDIHDDSSGTPGDSAVHLIGEESDGYITDSEDNDIYEDDDIIAGEDNDFHGNDDIIAGEDNDIHEDGDIVAGEGEEGAENDEMEAASVQTDKSHRTRTSRSTGFTRSQVQSYRTHLHAEFSYRFSQMWPWYSLYSLDYINLLFSPFFIFFKVRESLGIWLVHTHTHTHTHTYTHTHTHTHAGTQSEEQPTKERQKESSQGSTMERDETTASASERSSGTAEETEKRESEVIGQTRV